MRPRKIEERPPSVQDIAALIISSLPEGATSKAVALDEAKRLQRKWTSMKLRDFSALPGPRKHVINATGVLLHTNLGRAPLGPQLFDRLKKVLSGYADLEIDLVSGKRGGRMRYLDALFSSVVKNYKPVWVNNNAAAVLLALNTLKKEMAVPNPRLIISRGELVEIGGGFRVPEIMAEGGFQLVEVGTTNKTRLADYEKALKKGAAVVCAVHPSNFVMNGFTESVKPEDLIPLCRRYGARLIYDAGTMTAEEMKKLKPGFDIVTVSTDKTLGSVQGGLAMAKPELQRAMLENPLYRAMRLDKIALTALEFAFEAHSEKRDRSVLPLSEMTASTVNGMKTAAENFIARSAFKNFKLESKNVLATVGGGALPGQTFPAVGLAILPLKKLPKGATTITDELRRGVPAVLTSIIDATAVINLKTVMAFELNGLENALKRLDDRLSRDNRTGIKDESPEAQTPSHSAPK